MTRSAIMKKLIPILAVLGMATASQAADKWRFCGAAEDSPAAVYVNTGDVWDTGEFKHTELMTLRSGRTDVAEFTVSCRAFYYHLGSVGEFHPIRRGSAYWRAAQTLCNSNGPSGN
jgi:hypothetical protein